MTLINIEQFIEKKDKIMLQYALKYLSDLEIFGNQYDQKVISMYVLAVRAYLHALDNDMENAYKNLSGAKSLYYWLKQGILDSVLINAIEQFPKKNKRKTIQKNTKELQIIEYHLRKLVHLNIGDLINLSENIFDFISDTHSKVQYFVMTRDGIPLYDKQGKGQVLDSSLITGFVIALSQFLKEVISTTTDLNTIFHDKGVIILHKYENVEFILFINVNDLRFRVALRQFAFDVKEIIDKIQPNYFASDEEKRQLNSICDKVFGKF